MKTKAAAMTATYALSGGALILSALTACAGASPPDITSGSQLDQAIFNSQGNINLSVYCTWHGAFPGGAIYNCNTIEGNGATPVQYNVKVTGPTWRRIR